MSTNLIKLLMTNMLRHPLRRIARPQNLDKSTPLIAARGALRGVVGGHDDVGFLAEVFDCLGDGVGFFFAPAPETPGGWVYGYVGFWVRVGHGGGLGEGEGGEGGDEEGEEVEFHDDGPLNVVVAWVCLGNSESW